MNQSGVRADGWAMRIAMVTVVRIATKGVAVTIARTIVIIVVEILTASEARLLQMRIPQMGQDEVDRASNRNTHGLAPDWARRPDLRTGQRRVQTR